jgi:hypothetical protein
VHDSLLVRVLEAFAQLDDDVQLRIERHHVAARVMVREAAAAKELHHDVRSVAFLGELEHGHDIAMLQPRGGPRLPIEALARMFVRQHLARHHLHRDVAFEYGVPGLVQHAHAAATHAAHDPIPTDLLGTVDRHRAAQLFAGHRRRKSAAQLFT